MRSFSETQNYTIGVTDGAIGHLKECHFDDIDSVICYVVVDTGPRLSARTVLISPMSADAPHWESNTLPVDITRKQVRNSPGIDMAKPVPRPHEMEYLDDYGYRYTGRPSILGRHVPPQCRDDGGRSRSGQAWSYPERPAASERKLAIIL